MASPEDTASRRAARWRGVVGRIDANLTDRALITGALPPEARDLDIVVRPAERQVIARVLDLEGFLPRGRRVRPARIWVEQWVGFEGCDA